MHKRTNRSIEKIIRKFSVRYSTTFFKKSLKIPKTQSEFVNRRKTYNTMTKRQKDKGTNNDLQNIQHNDQKTKGQTTIYKTYNTMGKRHKDKQRSTKHTTQ